MFSAVCAALTLGLLARSVALLPHDRTDAQRKREHSDFSFLTTGSAWLPPVLAVLVCGLQMTFWQNATNYTGEMFDLLLFAFVIWSLLEYRLDEREWRLFLASFVYGAGMANNWAMVGFFPAFVAAISVDPRLELLPSAISPANGVVRAAGNDVFSFAAAAGRDFGQGAGDFLGDTESSAWFRNIMC